MTHAGRDNLSRRRFFLNLTRRVPAFGKVPLTGLLLHSLLNTNEKLDFIGFVRFIVKGYGTQSEWHLGAVEIIALDSRVTIVATRAALRWPDFKSSMMAHRLPIEGQQ
jgi:hypothetical protein